MRKEIPVVFATDENYLFYACVAISSLAESAKEGTFYHVYILVAEELMDDYGLMEKLKLRYPNITLELLKVDTGIFSHVIINNSHITKATFYRLILSELLKEEKCIYLDADILVGEDLTELFETQIDAYYAAGVRDVWIDILPEEIREDRRIRTQIPSMDQYINAGVLLLNLKKIRQDNMVIKFMDGLKKDYLYEDQDILNVNCYGNTTFLPAKWNLFTTLMGQLDDMAKCGVPKEIISDYEERKGIYHYASRFCRPWERYAGWLNKEWWQAASKWKEEPVYQELKEYVLRREYENSWQFYLGKIAEHEKLVIFGFTVYGKKVCDWLLANQITKPIIFVDNDIEKQGQAYKGIPVISLEESMGLPGEVLYIVSSQRRKQEVEQLLLDAGIVRSSIISYIKQSRNYYLYLDDRYYERELNDICMRETGKDLKDMGHSYEEMVCLLKTESVYQEWIKWYWMEAWILKEKE